MFRLFKTALIAGTALAITPTAFAELLIAPTRVVLENGERSTELVLVNKGGEEAAYRISLENRRMILNGGLETVETAEDGELFADEIVRFSPRRAILEPGGRQTVRITARTTGLAPGEYRSHLRIMGAPTSAGRTLAEAGSPAGDGISIELIAIRSLTIPIIIRAGNLSAEVSIESAVTAPSDEEGEELLVLRLTRSGDRSTYGDIQIFVTGQKEPVYVARGIAIYTPNTERDVYLPVPSELTDLLRGKDVRIAYVSSNPENPQLISDITLPVK